MLKYQHGLGVFVTAIVCFIITLSYQFLFPDFSLPLNANCRSKWGYAYAGELSELERIKLRKLPTARDVKVAVGWAHIRQRKRITETIAQYKARGPILDETSLRTETQTVSITESGQVWDETMRPYGVITAAMFAIAKERTDIVAWLEREGAEKHKGISKRGNALLFADNKWGSALRNDADKLRILAEKELGYKMRGFAELTQLNVNVSWDPDTDFLVEMKYWLEPLPGTGANAVSALMLAEWSAKRWEIEYPAAFNLINERTTMLKNWCAKSVSVRSPVQNSEAYWCAKYGSEFADELARQRGSPNLVERYMTAEGRVLF